MPQPAQPISGDDQVITPSVEQPPPPLLPPEDVKLVFNFQQQPWMDVLTWFAEQAGLSLQVDMPPPGTFNYRDTHAYSPAEALDLMNSVLLTKGYTLVRHNRMLLVINVQDALPPELIELVSLTELDDRGDFELLRCLFQLVRMDPSEAQEEIGQLIGPPPADVVALPKSGQLMVIETAAKLRLVRDLIEAVENPGAGRGEITEIKLQHVGAEEFLSIARPLLGLEEEQYANENIKIAVDPFAARLFATGRREAIQSLEELLPMVDRAPEEGMEPTAAPLETPTIVTYVIAKADPDSVLAVMQTLLAGMPDVRLALDPGTNKLVALARPTEHATIVETLTKLEGQADQVEVIPLRRMDPQLVILTITKLFPSAAEEGGSGPKVDGDPTTRKIWVRGTKEEIEQIRDLVEKLDGSDSALGGGVGDTIRFLPLPDSAADRVLGNVELFWPTLRANRIRMITPSAISPTLRQQRTGARPTPSEPPPGPETQQLPFQPEMLRSPPPAQPFQPPAKGEDSTRRSTNEVRTVPVSLPDAQEAQAPVPQEPASTEGQKSDSPSDAAEPVEDAPAAETGPPPDIVIARTQGGLIIACQDREALDDF